MNKIYLAILLGFTGYASAQTAAINGGVAVPITASPATSTTPGVTQPDGVTILVNGTGGTSVSPVTGIRKGNGAGSADTAGVAGTDFVSPSGLTAAVAGSLQKAANGSDIVSLSAFRTNLNLNSFNTGSVVGMGAGSSLWMAQYEHGGNSIDTVQGFMTFWVPTASSGFQVVWDNVGQGSEATCGPSMTITASLQYPVDGANIPVFFNGSRSGNLGQCGQLISDPVSIDTTATSQLVQVRYRASRVATDSTTFQANWFFGLFSGSSVLAPYTTIKVGSQFDGVEELKTRTVTDGAMTSGSATLTSATAAFVAQDVGQTVTVAGAGASGASLSTTILSYTNATTVTLATSASTAVSAATAAIVPADKTMGGTIYTGQGSYYAFAPHALLAKPTGVVKTVAFVGDSITWGQGGSNTAGSWAVQAINPAGVAAGAGTLVATAIPFANESMPGETAAALAVASKHANRMSLLGRAKYALGILGSNDFVGVNVAVQSAAQIEQSLTTIATNESQRGSQPYYGTIPPRNTSTDGWLTLANQTVGGTDSQRVFYNNWLRDSAPVSDSTGLPVAVGSAVATTNRTVYYVNGAAQVNPTSGVATASGPHPTYNPATGLGNPFGGTFEFANLVESSPNSGLWKIDNGTYSVTGCSMTSGSQTITCSGGSFTSAINQTWISVPGAGPSGATLVPYVTGFTNATTITSGLSASTTVSGVTITVDSCPQNQVTCGKFTADGTHPSPHGHNAAGAGVAPMVAGWQW